MTWTTVGQVAIGDVRVGVGAALAGAGLVLVLPYWGIEVRGAAALPIVGILLGAAALDLRTRRIPDSITLPGLVWALGVSLGPGYRVLDALLGCVVSAGLLLVIAVCSRGAIGGGDVKLMAVIGAATGPLLGLIVLFAAHVSAAVVALLVRASIRVPRTADPFPFGPFLALFGILAVIGSW